jgi:hypothetical protein
LLYCICLEFIRILFVHRGPQTVFASSLHAYHYVAVILIVAHTLNNPIFGKVYILFCFGVQSSKTRNVYNIVGLDANQCRAEHGLKRH